VAKPAPVEADRPLTPKQLRFIAAFVKGQSAQAAAVEAGYSKATSRSKAHTWLKSPRFAAAVAAMKAEKLREDIADADELRRAWTAILRDPKEITRDRLKAAELLGKSLGLFLEKVEHSGGVDVNHQVAIYLPSNGRDALDVTPAARLAAIAGMRAHAPRPLPSADPEPIDAEPPESPQEPARAETAREPADGPEDAPAQAREAGEGFEHYFRDHPAAGLRLV
jgi:phage terminase small subunit